RRGQPGRPARGDPRRPRGRDARRLRRDRLPGRPGRGELPGRRPAGVHGGGGMRILLVAPMFPPQRGVAPLRTHSFAATWAAEGHAVTVLTTRKRPDQVGLTLLVRGFEVVELPYRGPWPLELM